MLQTKLKHATKLIIIIKKKKKKKRKKRKPNHPYNDVENRC